MCGLPVHAQQPLAHADGRPVPSVRAVFAAEGPRLDGVLDDPVWATATPVTGFRRDVPSDGEPAAERTTVRVAYTTSALYVGARMHDRQPSRISRLRGRRDSFGLNNDQFLVLIDSYHDHRTAFVFGVTPAGGRNDVVSSEDSRETLDISWDPVWEVATQIDSLGWVAEIRIPLSQLRFSSSDVQTWGIQFRRDILAAGEAVDWSWAPATQAGFVSKFGHLVGLENVPQPGRLEVLPYVVARASFDQRADSNSPFDDGSLFAGSAGVDLKYGVSSALTLNATINPDFGQIEADPAVLNLTAFETFFPERRPFFVEGANIFEFGGLSSMRFFYTRRVGQPPSLSAHGTAEFVDQPLASTILGAAKLSGRTESGWSIGILNATTQRETAGRADSSRTPLTVVPVEPLANYSTLRVSKDLREGASQVGLIATAVFRDLDDPVFSVLRDRALTGGFDFVHRWAGRQYLLRGWAGGSFVHGSPRAITRAQLSSVRYYQRPDQDYLRVDTTATSLTGYGAEFEFQKEGGDWLYGANAQLLSPGLELNDGGFQTQSDRVVALAQGRRRWLEPTGTFRTFSIGAQGFSQWDFGGTNTARWLSADAGGQLQSFYGFDVNGRYAFETLDNRETRGGPLIVRPSEWRIAGGGRTDNRKTLSATARASYTRSDQGSYAFTFAPTLRGRGQGWWNWSLQPQYRKSWDDAFYVTQGSDREALATFGRRYLFGDLAQESLDLTVRLDLALTPNMTVQLYAQPFIASGDYEGFKALEEPRSYRFLTYGEGGSTLVFDPATNVYTADADGAGPAQPISFRDPDFRARSLRGNLVLRWEYVPGSTLFLVWSQDRFDRSDDPAFGGFGDLRHSFGDTGRNVFLLKINYWLSF